MRSVLSRAFVAVAAAAASVFAQLGPRVTVALEPPALTRRQTAIMRVRVDIPDGYYVPAETNGPIKGAWFQVVEPGFHTGRFQHLRRRCPST